MKLEDGYVIYSEKDSFQPQKLQDRVKYKGSLLWYNLGGTICASSRSTNERFNTGVVSANLIEYANLVAWLDQHQCDLINSSVTKLSENLVQEDLLVIIGELQYWCKKYRTVVITAGTDNISTIGTLAYLHSSNFFLLAGQRSMDKPTSELQLLLDCAIFAKEKIKNVLLCYENCDTVKILLPTRVNKIHTTHRDALDDGLGAKLKLQSLQPFEFCITKEFSLAYKDSLRLKKKLIKLVFNPHRNVPFYHHPALLKNDTKLQNATVISLGMNNLSPNYQNCSSKTRVPLGPENKYVYSTNLGSISTGYAHLFSLDAWIFIKEYNLQEVL